MPGSSPTTTASRSRKSSTSSIAARKSKPTPLSPRKKMPSASRKLTGAICPFTSCASKSRSSAAPTISTTASAKSVSASSGVEMVLMNASPSPRRILVRGVNWLGDAVMTTPALIRLREKFPEARITLLTPEKLRELWLHHPAVDEAIGFDAEEGLFSVSRKLREGSFELALVMANSPRSALEVWLAGIPRRVGYARPWRNWFLTQAVATRSGHVKMKKRSPAEIQRLVQVCNEQAESKKPIPETAHQLHEYLHLVSAL